MRAALTCLAATLLAGCAAAPSAPSGPRAERPTYQLGDKWFRNDGVYELIRIEDDRYVFAQGPLHQFHLTKDLGLARSQRGGAYFIELDPPIRLRWPLEVGRWGVSQGTWRSDPSPAGHPARFTWQVEAYGDVATVAGTFKAFRISVTYGSAAGSWAPRTWQEIQMWYAPEVRQFVKASSPGIRQLNFSVFRVERAASGPLEIALDQPKDEARVAAAEIPLLSGR